jgi:hypothetical protein
MASSVEHVAVQASEEGSWLNNHTAHSVVKIAHMIDTSAANEVVRNAGLAFAGSPPPAFKLRFPRTKPKILKDFPDGVYDGLVGLYSCNVGGAKVLGLSNVGPGVYRFRRSSQDTATRSVVVDVATTTDGTDGGLSFVAPLSGLTGRDPGALAMLAAKYHLSDAEWLGLGEDAMTLVPDLSAAVGGGGERTQNKGTT